LSIKADRYNDFRPELTREIKDWTYSRPNLAADFPAADGGNGINAAPRQNNSFSPTIFVYNLPDYSGDMGKRIDMPTNQPWPPGEWFVDLSNPGDLVAYKKSGVLAAGRTPFQEYEIFASPYWGKVLLLDGRLQSAQRDEFIYHEALAHPALLAHPEPRRVLILGGGEGATLREVLRHPQVETAVMVDLDRELVEVCQQWLPEFHQGAFADPRVELVFGDGRAWLADQAEGGFDVILLDLPEPLEEGPALRLFTREFYDLVQRQLPPEGLAAIQSGVAGPWARLLPDLHRTLKAVFPRVAAYTAFIPSFMDVYGFHLAGGHDFNWPSPWDLATRVEDRDLLALRWLEPEFAAALPLLPAYLQTRLVQEGRVLTDAAPFSPGAGQLF
jgi:spermidine synthase